MIWVNSGDIHFELIILWGQVFFWKICSFGGGPQDCVDSLVELLSQVFMHLAGSFIIV